MISSLFSTGQWDYFLRFCDDAGLPMKKGMLVQEQQMPLSWFVPSLLPILEGSEADLIKYTLWWPALATTPDFGITKILCDYLK